MRQLPELLSRSQSLFIKKCAQWAIYPDQERFWKAWESENLDEQVSKRIRQQEPASKAEAIAETERVRNAEREAELVLQSLFHFRAISIRLCKRCSREFATNYEFDRYCSNFCRTDALRERGIIWSIDKDEDERWAGQPPSTIKASTLEVLKQWAKVILGEETAHSEPMPTPVITTEPKSTAYMFEWMDPNWKA